MNFCLAGFRNHSIIVAFLIFSILYFISNSLPCKRFFVMSREFLRNANSTIKIINFVKIIFCQYIISCSACKCISFVLLFGARITKFDGFPTREHPTYSCPCEKPGFIYQSYARVAKNFS